MAMKTLRYPLYFHAEFERRVSDKLQPNSSNFKLVRQGKSIADAKSLR